MNFTRKLERELRSGDYVPKELIRAGVVLSDEDFLAQMDELKGDDGVQKFVGLVAIPEDVLEGEVLPEGITEALQGMALDAARMIARYRSLQKVGV